MKFIINISVLVAIVFCLRSVAQTNKKVVSDFSDSIVEIYYLKVYNAENCIKNNKIDSALKYYTDARKIFGAYQVNDRRNVMLCLNNCTDTSILKEWFKYGYYCAADSIRAEQYMELYQNYIPELIKSDLLSTLKQTTKKKWTYIDEHNRISKILNPLFDIDQKFHSDSFMNSMNNNIKISKKQRKVDNKNFKKIIACYKHFGDFSTNRLNGKNKDAFSAYKSILTHYFFEKENYIKNHELFIRQVRIGNLDPRIYAEIVDNYRCDTSQVYGCHTLFCYNDTIVVYKLSDLYKSQINKNRSQIFLQDIETLHNKQVWAWQNYFLYSFETIWFVAPEKSSDTIKEIAEKYKERMGPMVVGYTIYTR